MLKIRKPYDLVEVRPHVIGSAVEDVFRLSRDTNGNTVYTKVGETDVDVEIESYAPGCSLKAQLSRMEFVPVREKLSMLQQVEGGYSADMSGMPTDGTQAQIMLMNLKKEFPDLSARISKGESIASILKSYANAKTETKSKEEVITNGTNESSNE